MIYFSADFFLTLTPILQERWVGVGCWIVEVKTEIRRGKKRLRDIVCMTVRDKDRGKEIIRQREDIESKRQRDRERERQRERE